MQFDPDDILQRFQKISDEQKWDAWKTWPHVKLSQNENLHVILFLAKYFPNFEPFYHAEHDELWTGVLLDDIAQLDIDSDELHILLETIALAYHRFDDGVLNAFV